MSYHWDFSALVPYQGAFLRGVWITIVLAVLSSVLGTVLGIPVAIALRAHPVLARPVGVVVDVVRAIPNLVLLFFFYYFPYSQVLGLRAPTGFQAALIALTVAQAAYGADLIRSALNSVPRQQLEGVRAIGFRPWQVARHVILPHLVRQTLPGHVALWIGNVKLSSLASVIGVEDVVYVAKVAMSQSFRSLEAWMVVALAYIAIVLPMTYGQRRLEKSAWIRRQ